MIIMATGNLRGSTLASTRTNNSENEAIVTRGKAAAGRTMGTRAAMANISNKAKILNNITNKGRLVVRQCWTEFFFAIFVLRFQLESRRRSPSRFEV